MFLVQTTKYLTHQYYFEFVNILMLNVRMC